MPQPAGVKVEKHCFPVDVRSRRAAAIVPVFLPFSGCPGRCVYCAQDRQTGAHAVRLPVILEEAGRRVEAFSSGDCELAFYGGTFTALNAYERQICLDFLDRMRECGLVRCARCSTRPDALSGTVLDEVRKHGLSLIELGVQSFDSSALARSRRGYDGKTALQSCRAVRKAGFELGIQLLPGMPGSTPELFLRDVDMALAEEPSCLRFYPCLVPEGTVLARWYREGNYRPWPLDETVDTLGRALASAWTAGVPVIRLAVAPEAAFDTSLLAGPRHPALGAMVQARALLHTVECLMREQGGQAVHLELPARCQGFFYGDRGILRRHWERLGLGKDKVAFTSAACGSLYLTS